jgi:hypothetical protein
LGLARWIVNPRNPLTARVAVNRSWEQIFGRGIVETSEDFGTRGSPPTHPELLDWLATELVRQGWSLKALHRLIVTSSTYRQSSAVTHALLERDPNNRFLARGPRFRLDGEAIRDVALAASGLLSRKIGGPSVFPPQPEGIWSIPFNPDRWKTSLGEDRYRRGLYTFWRRSSPYPAFMIFDAPSREFCSIRRPRTNTPLQALTTLNDPGMFEMAQGLARRIVVEAGPAVRERAAHGLRRCVSRRPTPRELDHLERLFENGREAFQKDLAAARKAIGTELPPPGTDLAELAAWTLISNVLLNLDETLTKE